MRHSILFTLAVALSACATTGAACDDYVDYMCSCHDGDGDESCSDLEKQFEDADAELQDECSVSLDEQREIDEEQGVECDA